MFSLIYHSLAPYNITHKDIEDILTESRSFNKANGITGCLVYYKFEFLQILEGEQNEVLRLYDKITKDHRNNSNEVIDTRNIKQRLYPEWYMAYIDEKSEVDLNKYMDRAKLLEFHETAKYPDVYQKLFYNLAKTITSIN